MKNLIKKLFVPAVAVLLFAGLTSCVSIPDDDYDSDFSPELAVFGAISSSVESIEKASEIITPEEEYYIGRSVAASICTTYPIEQGSYRMTTYLNNIAETLVMNSDMPYLPYQEKGYHVVILNTDEINAMATPGGHIFVSRGLIDCTDSEDALAAVIAHEISHIQLGHSVQAIKASRVRAATANTGKALLVTSIAAANMRAGVYGVSLSDSEMEEVFNAVDKISDASNEVLKTLVNTGFSKEQEFQADKQALYLLQSAGYDPYAMLDMLAQLEDSPSNEGWGSTHPSPKERIKKVEKELSKMEKASGAKKEARVIRNERFEAEYDDYKIFEIE